MAFEATEEQIGFRDDQSQRILGKAFAGTGKTTSFVLRASVNQQKSLYVAFNKSIQLEAERKFPSHVLSKTMHSVAFARFGRLYMAIPNKLQPDLRPYHIKPLLSRTLNSLPESMHLLYCAKIIVSVKRYLVSADMVMSAAAHFDFDRDKERSKYYPAAVVDADMQLVWSEMRNPNNVAVPMLHDGYLKEFQLSQPKLAFDCIYFDEVQDTNPVTQAIVNGQNHAQLVFVGDEHQAIYSFRGAHNAIAELQVDSVHYLTSSFRFGQAVADVANLILGLKGETQELKGLGGPSSITSERHKGSEGHAFISRGNGTIFGRAVQALKAGNPFGFMGEIKSYRFDLINEIHNLKYGEFVRDPFIKSFSNYDRLQEYVEDMNDRELKSRIKVVEEYQQEIPVLIEKIEKNALPVSKNGFRKDILILTTAHKAKGTEFDTVQLASDFASFFEKEKDGDSKDPNLEPTLVDFEALSPSAMEEFNLQYVAATRAQKKLHLSDQISEVMQYEMQLKNSTSMKPR